MFNPLKKIGTPSSNIRNTLKIFMPNKFWTKILKKKKNVTENLGRKKEEMKKKGKKKKRVNICLGAHLIFHLPPPNPTIFTRIEPLIIKFSISMFYTSILQGVLSLCHPFSLCYKYVNIVKVKVLWVIHLKLKELSKVTFSFLPVSLFHSLSLLHFFFF